METLSSLVGPKAFRYVAFTSVQGSNTRYGFTGFLYQSLIKQGFRTFVDDRELRRRAQITGELQKVIKESKIFIIVLSENYASSSFCLDELVKILDEFTKGNGRWVLPVFYYVNVSDVRNQTSCFGQALAVHKNRVMPKRLEKWTRALSILADFSSCYLKWARDKYEYQYIEEILQEVSKHVACSIGSDHRVEKVMLYLYSGSEHGVYVVGICGAPGVRKTTVARGVYHSNAGNGFDCYYFFDKVGECVSKHGLLLLQQMLLSEIVGDSSTVVFEDVDDRMSMIKRMLNQKKIFLILEDIDDPDHLKTIVELTTCFYPGSKVIITAREKCLLESHWIKRIYEVERLNKTEAFQLLSLKAFDSMNVSPCYVTILNHVETYASSNPFILEVMGSYLSGKSIEECESALHQYIEIPNKETRKILQVSFDVLGKLQQSMLIHIALHLKERELAVIEGILHSKYRVCPKKDIRVLPEKCLIKINEHGHVTLHDLIQDMVKDNVPLEDPGSSTRLFEEYGERETQPAFSDGSMFWDPMELEYQSSYQYCSSSSTLNVS